ncbi:hypothetical protein WDZ92_30300, partial [Nostoc sp. NIES-2111]
MQPGNAEDIVSLWLELMLDHAAEPLAADDRDESHESRGRLSVPAALSTVLLARAISAEPGLRDELRRGAPVVTVEVPVDLVLDAEDVLHRCALGPATRLLSGSWLDNDDLAKPRQRSAAIFMPSERSGDADNARVRRALRLRVPVIGLAPDAPRLLPSDLLRMARRMLVLPPLDARGLALVIEAVIGSPPVSDVSDETLRFAELSDMLLAIHEDADPDGALAELGRLARIR